MPPRWMKNMNKATTSSSMAVMTMESNFASNANIAPPIAATEASVAHQAFQLRVTINNSSTAVTA